MGKDDDKVALERFQAYEGESLEKLLLHLKQGRLVAGRYADKLKLKGEDDEK